MKVWLLVDANYLCCRAFFSTGGLSFRGTYTGVAFGILRDLESLTDLHSADRCVMAFDGRGSLRSEVYPDYKISRKNKTMTDEEQERYLQFKEEVVRLREDILPRAGYLNVFAPAGYEADDVIAKVAEELPDNTEAVIISSDNDLLQCLSDRVMIYNPAKKKAITSRSFREEWGILPTDWPSVKAWAGCTSDDIVGVRGIGEKTAAKWVAGSLKSATKAYKDIVTNLEVYNRNIGLVRLPYSGLALPEIVDDDVTASRLAKVRADLGILTQRTAEPVGRNRGGLEV